MLAKKDAVHLKKQVAIRAAERWVNRRDIRTQPGKLKDVNPAEFQLQQLRQKNYISRESRRRAPAVKPKKLNFRERIIDTYDLSFMAPSREAMTAGIPVARIQNIPPQGFQPEGFATGFLVSPNLFLTNHHVFPDANSARDCAANFQYERTASGLHEGFAFALRPDRFYVADEQLDYALIYVEGNAIAGNMSLRSFNCIPLIATKGKIIVGQPLSIIQHPAGGPKQYAFANNNVLDILDTEGYIHYSTDTLEGSSGSPCFNASWEVAALHHQGIPFMVNGEIMTIQGRKWDEENMSEDEIQWVANEGISISRIVQHLQEQQLQVPEQQQLLAEVLELSKDPLLTAAATPSRSETLSNPQGHSIPPNPFSPPSLTPQPASMNFNFYGPVTIQIGGQFAATGDVQAPSSAAAASFFPNGMIVAEKKQRVDPDYDRRPGYDPAFLDGITIDLPEVIPSRAAELFVNLGTQTPYVLNYHHYSLVMNKDRRLLMWSASNVNYDPDVKSTKTRKEFGTESWIPDPRIPEKFQLTDLEFYKPATNIDRGHIVRREDNCWGETELEIEYANADTYHWPNCTPQHERFNQARDDGYKGLWGRLEAHLQNQLTLVDSKAILFAGPVLANDDPEKDYGFGPIQYPLRYWKVIVVNDADAGLSAYGFILDQTNVIDRFGLEEALLDFSSFQAQQVSISVITSATGVIFDRQVYDSDALLAVEGAFPGQEVKKRFRSPAEIVIKKKKTEIAQ